jgi:hypothetical protein
MKEIDRLIKEILRDWEASEGCQALEPAEFESEADWFWGTAPVQEVRLG